MSRLLRVAFVAAAFVMATSGIAGQVQSADERPVSLSLPGGNTATGVLRVPAAMRPPVVCLITDGDAGALATALAAESIASLQMTARSADVIAQWISFLRNDERFPLVTVFAEDKTVRHREAAFSSLTGPWAALSGITVRGYEIHHGQTAEHAAMAAAGDRAAAVMPDELAWQNNAGNVLGLYLHGLFEDPAVLQALFGVAARTLDTVFDGLAEHIDSHFEPGVLHSLIE